MPEIRHNLLTREWVVIATERAKRPDQFIRKGEKNVLPAFEPKCPFCPGNEAMTPPETYVVRDGAGWRVRVTPNKYGALSYEGAREISIRGIHQGVRCWHPRGHCRNPFA